MAIDDCASSITVAVRVRPFTIREAAQLVKTDDGPVFLGDGSLAAAPPKLAQKGIRPIIKVVDDKCLVFDPPEDNPMQKFSRSVVPQGKRVKDQAFMFDRVFDENTTQGDVYEATTRNLLGSVLDGYNATVFAYGATGCGKTHTITGTAQQPGIIFLTMQELFERIQELQEEKVIEISLSYLEIYNETIRDLLVPGGSKQGLALREDSHSTVSVSGLSSHHPRNVQEVMDMIVRGNEYRTMSPTEANATSSRSHAVLQINLSMKDRNADVNEPHTMATLSIIDLAGSERASATKNRGERLIEGANINKSLLALGSCINALCDPRKRNHVPYRNSKLTRLLKFALGGNCKTVMIVCVSPSSVHFDETQNTLRYANRAKNIQTKVTRNVYNVNRHVKDFLKKIDEQMALINELKQQQKDYEATAFAKFRKLVEKKEAIAREGVGRIRAAYENSAPERHERMNMMKKLRHIERRISLISTWIAGFDAVCDSRDEEEPPKNLVAMRKTAQGILTELEGSRQHYHQRLSKHTWDRALESALQTGIRQLRESDGSDGSEISALIREAEVLRGMADREAHTALLEQDKCGDSALIQVLLQAHFDTIAILDQILQMSEEDAVDAAKKLLGPIVAACTSASSQAIKPDGGLPVTEAFPPSKSGTPKRRKPANLIGPSPVPILDMARFMEPSLENLTNSSPVKGSPARSSPRRRRLGPAKKGISFTPKKKSPTKAGKRAVRWKDDTDDGPLAEYQATPKAIYSSTPEASSTELPPPPPKFTVIPLAPNFQTPYEEGSSPLPAPPESSLNLKGARPSRFQAGFLSKTSKSSPSDGSPTLDGLPPAPAAGGLNFSSDSDTSPLRELHPNRVPHHQLSPLHAVTNASAASSGDVTPADTASNGSASDDERRGGAAAPPKRASVVGMGHSKKGSWHVSSADAKTIRSALKRTSSVNGAPGSASSLSASVGGGGGSAPPSRAHRRRSPTASSGSPPSADSSLLLSTGQVRRMGLGLHHGENWRASAASVLSPRSAPIVKGAAAGLVAAAAAAARRTTVGEEVRGGVRGAPVRMSVGGAKVGGKAVWR